MSFFLFFVLFHFKNCPNSSNYSIFIFFFFDKKGFLIFCVFDLLSFFPLPCTVYLGVFVLKKTYNFIFETTTLFVIVSGIQLINQSYQLFLSGLIFLKLVKQFSKCLLIYNKIERMFKS